MRVSGASGRKGAGNAPSRDVTSKRQEARHAGDVPSGARRSYMMYARHAMFARPLVAKPARSRGIRCMIARRGSTEGPARLDDESEEEDDDGGGRCEGGLGVGGEGEDLLAAARSTSKQRALKICEDRGRTAAPPLQRLDYRRMGRARIASDTPSS